MRGGGGHAAEAHWQLGMWRAMMFQVSQSTQGSGRVAGQCQWVVGLSWPGASVTREGGQGASAPRGSELPLGDE